MKEDTEDYYSLGDVLDHIQSYLNYLLRKLWMLLLVFLASIGIAFFLYYRQKPNYEAVTTFILEEKSSGGGGLAGLASQFGFDIGGFSGGGMFNGDNILDILRSKKILNGVLLSKESTNSNPQTLADLFIDFSGWKKKWSSKPDLRDINFNNVVSLDAMTPKQDSILNAIHDFIIKHGFSAERQNKKGSIISVGVSASNSVFARLMAERIVSAAAKLYLDVKTGTAQANIQKLQSRSDSLLMLLNQKSYAAAATQPLDINPGIKSAIVPVEIATRDKTVLATLYAEVTKNLEASKLILSQQTPVIQILDRPGFLLNDHKKSLAFMLVVTPIAAIALFIVFAFPFFLWDHRKKRQGRKNDVTKSVEIRR